MNSSHLRGPNMSVGKKTDMRLQPWQRQMIRYLFPHSAKRLRIEEAFMVKFPHIPRALYKYRDFGNPYHLEGLEKDEQWFSSPSKFNDPLDTVVSFNTGKLPVQRKSIQEALAEVEKIQKAEASGGHWKQSEITDPISAEEYIRGVVDTLFEDMPEEKKQTRYDFIRQWNDSMNEELVSALSDTLRNGQSVLSLSANPSSTLMWSHYGASHTGFCIEYDFGSLPYSDMRKRMCFPVFYRSKRTDISHYLAKGKEGFNNLVGQYLCLMKSPEWSYEREWRIVHPIGPSHANQSYSMPSPSALIVGSQVSREHLDYAQDYCDRRSIPLRQAKLSIRSNEITVSDI